MACGSVACSLMAPMPRSSVNSFRPRDGSHRAAGCRYRAPEPMTSRICPAPRACRRAYVRRVGSNLRLGSGYVARDTSRFAPGQDARVVVNAVRDGSQGLRVEIGPVGKSLPGILDAGPAWA